MAPICLFCDNTADTVEHLWPDWLNDVLPNYADTTYTHRTVNGVRQWGSKRAANLTVKVVCESCNTGWMSDLEGEAKLLLTEPIRARKIALDKPQQRTIAKWAVKTAIIGEQMAPADAVIPRDVCRSLRESETLPQGLHVFTAATDATWPGDTIYHDHQLGPEGAAADAASNGYVATFAIRHLALQVIWTKYEQAVVEHRGPLITAVRRIWPFERSFTWPGGKVMAPSTVGMLAEHWRDQRFWTHPFLAP